MLKVINPGILTTIQDQGRKNYRSFGVPISGVMDHYAANCANYLLGNSEKEAVIEITMGGVTFDVMEDTDISVTGGDLNGLINEQPLPMWKKLTVHSGDQLTFKGPKSGMRTYIALPGGIESTSYLGSQSTFEKAGFGKAFQKGDNIKGRQAAAASSKSIQPMEIPTYTKEVTVRVVPSHYESSFKDSSIHRFYQEGFTIRAADRMGCQLQGHRLERKENIDILSEATTYGTIQVPAEGSPIILLADAQTTGGYPTIGTVLSEDLWRIAQLPPGGKLFFERYPLQEEDV
ncbi:MULTISPECIES: 5-oxoprolinase subunit C family protein [Allobacillus]|uniref:Biotin-dependent carboxyltransferase family protein n=1 Tax=Allobacillus halotolerans TaxID=570278 RepID=A0ABS6GQW4_9BACI|nr:MULTISPECIES: biotin-dependent carboxyltransferase family protein [Allobacillus]MBU6081522.1 biotin-dependent carboxyltransferase family protein [Allobacillus halotolerans]TSJ69455.1 biotin-dependent carboxyltransferase family protein [Allobacillus sp. SKP2-8]